MSKSTFTYLLEVVNKSKNQPTAIPKADYSRDQWSGIGFRLKGGRYVCPIPEVAEVLPLPKYTHVPGVQGWMHGLANVRGRLLPIMDLKKFLFGASQQVKARKKKVIIIDQNNLYSGLIVDEVLGMQHFNTQYFANEFDASKVPDEMVPYIRGQYSRGQEVWPIFSPFKLASDPKFLAANIG